MKIEFTTLFDQILPMHEWSRLSGDMASLEEHTKFEHDGKIMSVANVFQYKVMCMLQRDVQFFRGRAVYNEILHEYALSDEVPEHRTNVV